MRAAGPLVRIGAPAGGPVWVVTDAELARRVLHRPPLRQGPRVGPTRLGPAKRGTRTHGGRTEVAHHLRRATARRVARGLRPPGQRSEDALRPRPRARHRPR